MLIMEKTMKLFWLFSLCVCIMSSIWSNSTANNASQKPGTELNQTEDKSMCYILSAYLILQKYMVTGTLPVLIA